MRALFFVGMISAAQLPRHAAALADGVVDAFGRPIRGQAPLKA
jgi:hypothetical protein